MNTSGLELEPRLNTQLGQGFVSVFWLQGDGRQLSDGDLIK